mmetsp:Transcript_140437/g.244507  ORF Transcript_140437/g.244507 Transcript_140437/m.244507 type:complete len:261 (+) Transcript_140437:690-1472(+)
MPIPNQLAQLLVRESISGAEPAVDRVGAEGGGDVRVVALALPLQVPVGPLAKYPPQFLQLCRLVGGQPLRAAGLKDAPCKAQAKSSRKRPHLLPKGDFQKVGGGCASCDGEHHGGRTCKQRRLVVRCVNVDASQPAELLHDPVAGALGLEPSQEQHDHLIGVIEPASNGPQHSPQQITNREAKVPRETVCGVEDLTLKHVPGVDHTEECKRDGKPGNQLRVRQLPIPGPRSLAAGGCTHGPLLGRALLGASHRPSSKGQR